MKELVEFIVKNLVSDADAVQVVEEVKDRETVYTVKIADDDFGRIIGRSGKVATAIRTVVVVVMAWGMVFITNAQNGIAEISKRSWLFLVLSGLATGASWLCYYKALQTGDASKVVPVDKLSVVITLVLAFVFLHEQFTTKSLIGCILIGIGTLVMVL